MGLVTKLLLSSAVGRSNL